MPFHAGSVALVWSPTTGRVISQYHVVFDDDFTTVSYIEAGTIPPNWEDLSKYLSDTDTSKDVNLSDTRLNGTPKIVGVKDNLSDPLAVVTGHYKRQKKNTIWYSLPKLYPISAYEEDISTPPRTIN